MSTTTASNNFNQLHGKITSNLSTVIGGGGVGGVGVGGGGVGVSGSGGVGSGVVGVVTNGGSNNDGVTVLSTQKGVAGGNGNIVTVEISTHNIVSGSSGDNFTTDYKDQLNSLLTLKPELLLNGTGLLTVYWFIKNFIG